MANRKTTKPVSNWLDQADEVPRADVPANRDRSKRQRFYRRFIVVAIVLLPFSLLGNFLSFGMVARGAVTTETVADYTDEGKNAAILSVESWLAGEFSPLPGGGRLVAWDGAETVDVPELTEQEERRTPVPDYALEIHSLTVVDGTGTTYLAQVQVATSSKIGAVVLGTPSFLPHPAADANGVAGASPWIGVSTTQVPESVTAAIRGWATAFTSGDPDSLRLAVQDSEGQHSYVPLYNVESFEVRPVVGAYLLAADAPSNVTTSDTMLVQIRLSVQWAGAPALEPGQSLPTITYDLLVKKANTAAPQIVAWGGAGTGPQLTAFENAVTGREVSAPNAPKPTTTPNPTETQEPADDVSDAGDE